MASIWECQNKIRRYERLKTNCLSLVDALNPAVTDSREVERILNDKYTFNNDVCPSSLQMEKNAREVEDIISTINGRVIPGINQEIDNLNQEIDRIREEEERKRREEEEEAARRAAKRGW